MDFNGLIQRKRILTKFFLQAKLFLSFHRQIEGGYIEQAVPLYRITSEFNLLKPKTYIMYHQV